MRTSFALLVLVITAACKSTSPSAKDPFSFVRVQDHLHQAPRSTYNYQGYLVRVNDSASAAGKWGVLGDYAAGHNDETCNEFDGVPSGGANDSLLVAVALVRTQTFDDTVFSPSFMPLTGPTPDSASVWNVEFTDTAVIVTELPAGSNCNS